MRTRLPRIAAAGVLALVVALTGMRTGEAGSETSGKRIRAINRETNSDYIYYPVEAQSYFQYEDTGFFAPRPMVVQRRLPVITQPAYFYAETPRIPPVRAPMPRIAGASQPVPDAAAGGGAPPEPQVAPPSGK
ncbi:MAG: hypothetical protein HQM03_15525 [Magnetococcales bacterium]|nr:hypothetical protein [Magnetococcales bacterium]